MANTCLERTNSLQQALLDSTADAHNLTGSLHLSTELVRSLAELIEWEASNLSYDVIQRRLRASRTIREHNLVEGHTYCNLRCYASDRETTRLRSQRRRARNSWVNLDDIVVERERIQCKLNVTSSLNLQCTNNLQCAGTEHLSLLVSQSLARSNYDRVAGVNTYRIDILHITDGNRSVVLVAHYLVLNLLVTLDTLLNQHLVYWRECQSVTHQLAQLSLVINETTSCTTECKCWTEYQRITNLLSYLYSLLDRVYDLRWQHRLAQVDTELLEQLTILSLLDTLERCTQDLNTALLQDTLLSELNSEVQTCLATQARNDSVRTLVADNLCHILQLQRLHIDLVGDECVGHNSCRVRVYEDNLIALLLQCKASLCTCVVELGSLTNYDWTRANHHYLLYICSLRHLISPPSI